jgi:hypothetical protein
MNYADTTHDQPNHIIYTNKDSLYLANNPDDLKQIYKPIGPNNPHGGFNSTINYNGIRALDGTYMCIRPNKPSLLFEFCCDEFDPDCLKQIDFYLWASVGRKNKG